MKLQGQDLGPAGLRGAGPLGPPGDREGAQHLFASETARRASPQAAASPPAAGCLFTSPGKSQEGAEQMNTYPYIYIYI